MAACAGPKVPPVSCAPVEFIFSDDTEHCCESAASVAALHAPGGAHAEDTLSRRDSPHRDVTARIHATSGRACPTAKAQSHSLPWRARATRRPSAPRAPHFVPVGLGAAKPSSHVTVQRYHFCPSLQLVEIVSPLLHHLPALFDEFRPVVSRAQRVGNTVR